MARAARASAAASAPSSVRTVGSAPWRSRLAASASSSCCAAACSAVYPPACCGVRVGAGVEQVLSGRGVPRRGGRVERAQVRVVVGHGVRIGAGGEQQLDRFRPAEEGGVVQRGEAVGRAPADELRVGGERAVQVLGPAQRGQVEPVERRLRGEQRLERRGLAVIQRQAHGRDAVLARSGQLRLARQGPLERGHVAGLDRGDHVHRATPGRRRPSASPRRAGRRGRRAPRRGSSTRTSSSRGPSIRCR